MKNSTKRCVGMLVAVIMLLTAMVSLAACADSGDDVADGVTTTPTDNTAETTPAASGEGEADTTPAETEAPLVDDDIPADLNFNGEVMDILAWKQGVLEYDAESQTGDAVNDAIYLRNIEVETRLGVELSFNIIPGNSTAFKEYCQTVMTAINAGDDSYDALACYLRSAGVLSLQNALVDLYTVDHLNFEKPWWPASLTELNTVNDRLYFMSGDIAASLLYQMMFVVYNNDLGTDLALEDPQLTALDGKWTLDKLVTMATNVYADLDGDGVKSVGDRYGLFSMQHPTLDIFYMGTGMHYLVPSSTGELKLSEDVLSEKSYSVIDKLNSVYYSSNDGYFQYSLADDSILMAGNSLFYNTNGQILTQKYYHSEMSYSILPAPKYDEAQEKYLTPVAFTHSMYCIPTSASKTDMSGAAIECMASEGYKKVTPALFENSLKYKYSNNENDALLFEHIRAGVVFDIGRPFFDEMGGDSGSPVRVWRQQIENGVNRLASTSRVHLSRWEAAVERINKALMS